MYCRYRSASTPAAYNYRITMVHAAPCTLDYYTGYTDIQVYRLYGLYKYTAIQVYKYRSIQLNQPPPGHYRNTSGVEVLYMV